MNKDNKKQVAWNVNVLTSVIAGIKEISSNYPSNEDLTKGIQSLEIAKDYLIKGGNRDRG